MPKTDIAKLFQNGRSQAVRLPREFRFEGEEVRIRRVARGVLQNPKEWFKKLDDFNLEAFALKRHQPKAPKRPPLK